MKTLKTLSQYKCANKLLFWDISVCLCAILIIIHALISTYILAIDKLMQKAIGTCIWWWWS